MNDKTGKFPSFKGELLEAREALSSRARDFGRLLFAEPRAVLLAADAEDVARAVKFARTENLAVVARGQAHTTRGQSLQKDGLVIETAALSQVIAIDETAGAAKVRVEAGITWQALLKETCKLGLTPPVLTDYIDLTVGGTLSVGGLGGQSFRHGLQLDNVYELGVVTGCGELVRCSAQKNAALFDACRGGLGQFGIIVDATLRLVPAPASVEVYHLTYKDLKSFLGAQEALIEDGRFDYVLGNIVPLRDGSAQNGWELSVECVHYQGGGYAARSRSELLAGLDFVGEPRCETKRYYDYANRLAEIVAALKASGRWSGAHPWIDLFLPAAAAEKIIAQALSELSHAELGDGYVMTYPILRRNCHSIFPGLPDEGHVYLFDMLPFVAADADHLLAFEHKCLRHYESAKKCGATVYPIGYPLGTSAMTEHDWRRQLGGRYEQLCAVKKEFDPDGILNRQLGIFGGVGRSGS